MATITIYDDVIGATYTLNITLQYSVIKTNDDGKIAYYITASTSAKDTLGQSIPTIVITDSDPLWTTYSGDVTGVIGDVITQILTAISGGYLSSSSSSSSSVNSSSSSSSSSKSSQSSSSLSSSSTEAMTSSSP